MGVTWVDWRSIRIPPPTERVDPPFTFQRSSTIRSVLWPPTGPLHENPLQGSSSVHKKKLTSNLRPKIKLRLKRLSLDRMKLLHNEVIFFSVYDHKLVDFGGQIEERRQYFADTDVTVSSLLIEQAHLGHSGNYTCQPAHCPPSSARIHILKGSDGGFSTCSFFSILIKRCSRLWSIGEQPAAMQRSSSTMDASDAALRWRILSVAITFHLCYFHVL